MDTKSKKLRYSIWFKIVAWGLCIASMCGILFTVRAMGISEIYSAVPVYADSETGISYVRQYADTVQKAYFPPSDEQIKSDVSEYVAHLQQAYENETEQISQLGSLEEAEADYYAETWAEDSDVFEATTDVVIVQPRSNTSGQTNDDLLEEYKQSRLENIEKEYLQLTENAEEKVRSDLEEEQKAARENLEKRTDMQYAVARYDEVLETNVRGDNAIGQVLATDAKVVNVYNENGSLEYGHAGSEATDITGSGDYYGQPVIYASMTPALYQSKVAEYDTQYAVYKQNFAWLIACIAAFLLGFVWLMYAAGRRVADDRIHLLGIDHYVYLDIGFLIMVVLVVLMMLAAFACMGLYYYGNADVGAVGVVGTCACVSAAVSVLLIWSMSASRRGKDKSAQRFTLFYKIFGGIKEAYDTASVTSKSVGAFVWYVIAGLVVSIITIVGFASWEPLIGWIGIGLMVLYVVLSAKYVYKRAAGLSRIEQGVNEIKSGNMEYVIPKCGIREIDNIAGGINNIAEGLESAVQREVKAERMRTELITNISHDLKTPLTSILTYVDLMKKEKGLSAEAKKYLEVLDVKSTRLKVLTDDLFEAAKASSGDMTVSLERMELTQFMEQVLGEMSDRIKSSGLAFINDIPPEKAFVMADGKLLFRVVGNVLDNAMKYSAEGSRVYINLTQDDDNVCVIVKNISKEELNISEDELMERFVRGDSSRNTEGSGLGLAIARNFVQLMGGRFIIEIDGDLFKVRVCIPKSV